MSLGRALVEMLTVLDSTAAGRPDYLGHFSHSSLAPVRAFVPRARIRDEIRARLCDGATGRTTSTLMVWGLGGAGKTQLLLDYVQHYRTAYKATFWVEAGQTGSLERDFVNLYQTLFRVHNVAGLETVSAENAVTAVKSWFSGQQGPWLFVFDGADSIDDETARGYIAIKHFIPDVPSMHVVVTTRSRVAEGMTRLGGIHVGDMEEAQAIELFYRCSELHRDNESVEEVEAIVKELGYLALAITLAGTYIGTTHRLRSDIKKYLPEYRQRRRQLLDRPPDSAVHQYSKSVLTTWETSYQAIAESNCPEASVLLTLLSFLSSDDIFPELFGAGIHISAKAIPAMDKYKVEDCFKILERYAMVQWKKDQESFAMHKLVHAWGFERLDRPQQQGFSIAVLQLVAGAIAGCSNQPKDRLRLVPHVMANYENLAQSGQMSGRIWEEAVDEVERTGTFLEGIGRYREKRVVQEFVLNERKQHLGEEHPDTISAINNLATTLGDQGQLSEAAQMQREVLKKRRRILGEEHPNTISTINNLAITLREQGQLEEAAQMQREVLEKMKRILGEEHPNTISAINNLATTLGVQGQLSEAAQMQREVLKKRRRILGEEHPNTISTINNLAITLGDQGQLSEAAQMQREVLEKMRRILGEEHPDTIGAINNLANTLGD